MSTAAKALKSAYKKKGYTLRSLSKEVSIGFKTLQRYSTGETSIPPGRDEKLARILFSGKERSDFLSLCAIEYDDVGGTTKKRRERKKDLTSAKKTHYAFVRIDPNNPSKSEVIVEATQWVPESMPGGGFEDTLHPVFTISIENGLSSFECEHPDHGGDIFTAGSAKQWSTATIPYFHYCRSKKLSLITLLDLAKEAIMNCENLKKSEYEKSGNLIISKSTVSEVLACLEDESLSKKAIIHKIKRVVTLPDQVDDLRIKLVEQVDSISSRLSPSA